jgi:hypothetical protein
MVDKAKSDAEKSKVVFFNQAKDVISLNLFTPFFFKNHRNP